jgi:hypothetical protein
MAAGASDTLVERAIAEHGAFLERTAGSAERDVLARHPWLASSRAELRSVVTHASVVHLSGEVLNAKVPRLTDAMREDQDCKGRFVGAIIQESGAAARSGQALPFRTSGSTAIFVIIGPTATHFDLFHHAPRVETAALAVSARANCKRDVPAVDGDAVLYRRLTTAQEGGENVHLRAIAFSPVDRSAEHDGVQVVVDIRRA